MGASTALAARSGWSIWPGMPGQFAPEWGGQFDAESLVTFRRNWVVNISGISTNGHRFVLTRSVFSTAWLPLGTLRTDYYSTCTTINTAILIK
jgi:hypothetical protein